MAQQHTVRITTTTTENSNVLVLNTGYIRTQPGLLKLAQLILGIVCVTLLAWYNDRFVVLHAAYTFCLLMAVTFLICTTCLLVSIVASWATGSLIAKTLFELIYHAVATLLLGAAAISMLVHVSKNKNWYQQRNLFTQYLVASILALINACLYLGSAVLAQRSYRGI